MTQQGDTTRPSWARRIVDERGARRWSQSDLANALRMHAANPPEGPEHGTELPSTDSLCRRIKAWEKGDNKPDSFYSKLIARSFGTVTQAFFPPEDARTTAQGYIEPAGLDTLEIVSRIQRSDVDSATLDRLRIMVDRLCCEYPYAPGATLAVRGRQLLGQIGQMLQSSRLNLAHHREAMVLAGWLCLLVGCCEYDLGDRSAAEATRRAALSLATESGHTEIAGWAHEMRAWFALTSGDYRGVVAAARAGTSVASPYSVNVQLLAQEAKAWARVGDRRKVEVALDKGRNHLDSLPYPEDPSHHFVVDPSKFDFYAMDCYRILGENDLARTYADEVIRSGTDFSGFERSTMRNTEARITLGVVAARDGNIDRAVEYGHRALDGDRQSLPSLLMVSRELSSELSDNHADDPEVRDYLVRLQTLSAS